MALPMPSPDLIRIRVWPDGHRRPRRRAGAYRAAHRLGADCGAGDAGDDQRDRGGCAGGGGAPAPRTGIRASASASTCATLRRRRWACASRRAPRSPASKAAPSPFASRLATSASRSARARTSAWSSTSRASTSACSASWPPHAEVPARPDCRPLRPCRSSARSRLRKRAYVSGPKRAREDHRHHGIHRAIMQLGKPICL